MAYLISGLKVGNDMVLNGGVQFSESGNRRESTEFSHLFVGRQPMVTPAMNDVGQTILIKVYRRR